VTLSARVAAVRWRPRHVEVTGPDLDAIADALVLTVPASVTGAIAFDPPLPQAKREALTAVTLGHAAKLFVELEATAPPSAVLSVPERYWCWTQLGPDGEPLPVLSAFAGSPGALRRLGVADGPARWLASLAELRPELELRPKTAMLSTWADDPWARGAYSARALRAPLRTDALAATVGPIAFAGEHTAGEWHGLMEGGLRSGIRAARELLEA
jgi:monoamine oxidase